MSKKEAQGASNLAEAALHALGPAVQRYSSKVNYEALSQILESDRPTSQSKPSLADLLAPQEEEEGEESNDEEDDYRPSGIQQLMRKQPIMDEFGEVPEDEDDYGGYDEL